MTPVVTPTSGECIPLNNFSTVNWLFSKFPAVASTVAPVVTPTSGENVLSLKQLNDGYLLFSELLISPVASSTVASVVTPTSREYISLKQPPEC